MIIYKSNKKDFVEITRQNKLVQSMLHTAELANFNVSPSEITAWKNSLVRIKDVVDSSSIPDSAGIAIEFKVPLTNKRIDFLISGYDKLDNESVVVVELKQWEKCEKVLYKDAIVTTRFRNNPNAETSHPSYQAYSYVSLMKNFLPRIYNNKNFQINSCAYLHNYNKSLYPDLMDKIYQYWINISPIFTQDEFSEIQNFILEKISKGDNCKIIDEISSSEIKPSKSVQNYVKKVIEGNPTFNLVDDQKIVFEDIKLNAFEVQKTKQKKVYILPGGPGTGKTLIALSLLSTFINNKTKPLNTIYVSKNQSLRKNYEKLILSNDHERKFSKTLISNLLKGSAIFTNKQKNRFDAVIVDESQRLMTRSQYTKKGKGFNNQIREIIHESWFSVFMIDEKQSISMEDIGTIEEIKNQALIEGVLEEDIIIANELENQFRSTGSNDYVNLIDNILYNENKNVNYNFLNNYDVKIFDNPNDLRKAIEEKNSENNNSRIISGYCWDWVSKKDSSLEDIHIGDFKMKWNLKNDETFALTDQSINQSGSIHTVLGMEFQYAGIIIGEDLRVGNGKIITDFNKRAKTDRTLWGIKTIYKEGPDKALKISENIIKNTYRVLLTRGIKGTYIYCKDKELSEFLKKKLKITFGDY